MTLAWKHPLTATIAGGTGSGKTVFMAKFLENLNVMLDTEIEEIIWCYGISQKFHSELADKIRVPIRFLDTLPDIDTITSLHSKPKILVLDDMQEDSEKFVPLFIRGSHHRNLSIFMLIQNVFGQGKGMRDLSLNSHYLVLFKNPRDQGQIGCLARQIDGQNSKYIIEAYRDATSIPHGYIVFDFKQDTNDDWRIRTKIFPGEENSIYVPRKRIR
jgi:hypothetical protein